MPLLRPLFGLGACATSRAPSTRRSPPCRAAPWPPIRTLLFEEWFAEARAAEPNDPEAMALATADADGRPSVRMVLLKGHDARGFVFYTNSESRKGGELAANPRAALLFHWKSLRRQVRIEGRDRAGRATPRPTPISPPARAMRGSAPGRRTSRARSTAAPPSRRATRSWSPTIEGRDVPRPPYWWGYRARPRPDRILDRSAAPPARAPPVHAAPASGWSEGLLYP